MGLPKVQDSKKLSCFFAVFWLTDLLLSYSDYGTIF